MRHATAPDRRRAWRAARPRRAGADVQGRDARPTASSGTSVAAFAAGLDGARPRARRARRRLPRQADRDRRRRSSAPRPPAASSSRSTRCCRPQQVALHPRRLRRARARHDRRSGSSCCATSSRDARRSSTWSWSAARREPADAAVRGARLGRVPGAPATRRSRTSIDVDMAAILYTSGSTGKPKGVVLSHRNLIVGGAERQPVPRERRGRRHPRRAAAQLRRRLQPAHDRRSRSAPTSCWSTTCCRATSCGCAPSTGSPGSPACRRCGSSSPSRSGRRRRRASLRYFANTGGRMPQATLDKLRAIFPQAKPYLMYGLTEAFRSTYLDPAEVDRRPDSIGKAIPNAEILVVRAGRHALRRRARRASSCTAARWWRWATGTTRSAPPSASGRRPGRDAGHRARPRSRSGRATSCRRDEEGFLYFVGRKDEMIKTSGYRVSPTEIEEVAYGTGLVARRGRARRRRRPRSASGSCSSSARPNGSELDADDAARASCAQQLPLYMVPERRRSCAPSCRARRTASSTATCCARSWRRMSESTVAAPRAAVDCRRASAASRSSGSPSGSAARRSSPTTGALLTERVELLRATLPAGDRAQLRGQGQPDAGGRPAPQRARRLASTSPRPARCGSRSTRRCRPTGSASPARARRRPSSTQAVAAGVTIEMESETEAERVVDDRRAARHPPARRRPRQPGLPGQGLRHADGRRAAAVRRRRRAGARRCSRELAARRPRLPRLPHLRRLAEPQRRDPLRGAAQDRRARAAARRRRRRCRSATSTSAAASASRTSRRTSRSTSPRSARTSPACWPTRSARTCPTRGSSIELGRYIVGECGVYVTRVVDRKESRGKTFLVVDGGLHHQLAASGNFGQVIRRNYPVAIGNRDAATTRPRRSASSAACARRSTCSPTTSTLPPADVGDLVVVFQAGAYGLTASPTAFLSHPAPAEVLV